VTPAPRIRRRPERIYTLEVSMDPCLVKRIKEHAAGMGRNVSACVSEAVGDWLVRELFIAKETK
jgi:hypothetical protein